MVCVRVTVVVLLLQLHLIENLLVFLHVVAQVAHARIVACRGQLFRAARSSRPFVVAHALGGNQLLQLLAARQLLHRVLSHVGVGATGWSLITVVQVGEVVGGGVARGIDVSAAAQRGAVVRLERRGAPSHGLAAHARVEAAVGPHLNAHAEAQPHDRCRGLRRSSRRRHIAIHKLATRLAPG